MKKAAFNINALLLCVGLPLFMIIKTLVEESSEFPPLLSMRKLGILSKSFLFGLLVAILVAVLSWFMAYLLFLVFNKRMLIYVILIVLTIIPSFLYAYLWMNSLKLLFHQMALSGLLISILVQVNYFFPFAILLWYHIFQLVSQEYFDQTYLNIRIKKGHVKVLIEMSKMPFSFIVQIFLLLGIADYTIPSIFAYNTYPIEIMSIFASSLSLAPAILASIPMIVVTIILVQLITRHRDFTLISSLDAQKVKLPSTGMLVKWASYLFVTLFSLPFILMAFSALSTKNLFEISTSYISEYCFTISTAFIAGFCIVLISYLIHFNLLIQEKKRKFVYTFMILLFGIPGTAIGLFVNSFYQQLARFVPALNWINRSSIPLIHVDFLRFLPIGFLILGIGFSFIPRSYIEQGMMESKNHIKLLRVGLYHEMIPYFLLTGFVSLILSISELSGAIMVLPPGKSTITVTIYNYLHYGSTDVVGVLSLIFVLIILLLAAGFYIIYKKKIKVKKFLILILMMTLIIGTSACKKEKEDLDIETINQELDILTMEVYQNRLYIGTTTGLYVLDEKDNLSKIELIENLGFIHGIYASEQHGLFIGGMNGLVLISEDTNQEYFSEKDGLSDNRVYVINEDKNNHVFIGTFKGLVELDENLTFMKSDIELLSPMVNVLEFDERGNIIIASYNVRGGGLTLYNQKKSTFFGEESQLSTINTTSLCVQGNVFFIGGGMYESGGLDKFELINDSYQLVKSFEKNILAGPKVRSLLIIEHELFVGSEYDGFALLNFDHEFEEILSSKVYTSKDGLSHNEVKCMINYNGYIYFGTKAGLSRKVHE